MKYQCLCGDDCESCKICRFPACECTCTIKTADINEDKDGSDEDDDWG